MKGIQSSKQKKSTYQKVKTGAKIAKTVFTSKYVQGCATVLLSATVGAYLRRRTLEKEGVL